MPRTLWAVKCDDVAESITDSKGDFYASTHLTSITSGDQYLLLAKYYRFFHLVVTP